MNTTKKIAHGVSLAAGTPLFTTWLLTSKRKAKTKKTTLLKASTVKSSLTNDGGRKEI